MIQEYELSRIEKCVKKGEPKRPYIAVMWRKYGGQIHVPASIVRSPRKWKNAIAKIRAYCERNKIPMINEVKFLNDIKELVQL